MVRDTYKTKLNWFLSKLDSYPIYNQVSFRLLEDAKAFSTLTQLQSDLFQVLEEVKKSRLVIRSDESRKNFKLDVIGVLDGPKVIWSAQIVEYMEENFVDIVNVLIGDEIVPLLAIGSTHKRACARLKKLWSSLRK